MSKETKTVWIVIGMDYGCHEDIMGVFSNRESADKKVEEIWEEDSGWYFLEAKEFKVED